MGTHYKGSREEMRALDCFIKLSRASESVISRTMTLISEAGLTISQFGTLETLYHLGPQNQNMIATKLLKSSGNITMVIDNLEKTGFVKRTRSKKDKRYIKVSLTARGRRLICDLFPKQVALIKKEMEVLSEEEQEKLSILCKKIGIR